MALNLPLNLPTELPSPSGAPSASNSQTTNVAGSVVPGTVATGGGNFAGRDQYNFYGLPQWEQFAKLYGQATDALAEAEFKKQLDDYLGWVIRRTAYIELRGVKLRDGNQYASLKLAEVYVTLNAELVGGRGRNQPNELALERILTTNDLLAVIGGPGCGKTTVLLYMAWVLANAFMENRPQDAQEKLGLQLDAQQPTLPLPIYVPLNAYARQRFHSDPQRDDSGQTLLDFLPSYLYKARGADSLPAAFLARLLASGKHVILLLDGLDEVADEGERRVVREAIENLVTSHEHIRVTVTCRTVAFQGRSVLARGFQQINVRPLNNEQVTLLVRKAYEYQYHDDEIEQKNKTDELLAGIKKLEADHARRGQKEERRLVDSPLMVRMLLVVHLSDRKLPQHRAELYQRFTETILHSDHAFDDEVAVELSKLAGNSLELLRTLAFGMHQRRAQQGRDIDEDALRLLLKPSFASETAPFLRLTRQRGTLLEERDGLYRFLHLAFQEYLAACYLVDDYALDEGFAAKLRFFSDGEVLNSWWREVALLIPGYLSMGKRQQAYKFVRALAGLDDGRTDWATLAANWSPDVQLAAAEIAGTAGLEWFADESEPSQTLRQQLDQRLLHFFNTPALFNQTQPTLRAQAGRTLSALGDPRFDQANWYLPADSMLGFVEIPAGEFSMGEDGETHKLELPTFYIARYPVTVGQFRAYLEDAQLAPRDADSLADPDNHPVRYVTWVEATGYCQWLTKKLRNGDKTPAALATKLAQGWQIMLPSEAEWERAARGTDGGIYPWGNEPVDPNRANYAATGINTTSAVGCFPAGSTPLGVHDLLGNVWEWTRSLNQGYPYPSDEKGRQDRERWRSEDVTDDDWLVVRGGCYYNGEKNMRAPLRDYFRDDRFGDVGLRLVCGAAPRLLKL